MDIEKDYLIKDGSYGVNKKGIPAMLNNKNPYEPVKAVIVEVITETPTIKTFKIEMEEHLKFTTGQFIQLTVPGIGECPFTPSSKPGKTNEIDVTVMKAGVATEVLHTMKKGDMVAVRGPYGKGFPLEKFKNRELVIVGGGCGIAPLRSLIFEILNERNSYPRVILLYGCKTPEDVIYKESFGGWGSHFEMHRTVDNVTDGWNEGEGVVTTQFKNIDIDIKTCAAVVVGPPVMMKFATIELVKMGVSDDRIYLSLEKNMTCGFGKCRHCLVGGYYVCKDGPVFAYKDIKDIRGVWD